MLIKNSEIETEHSVHISSTYSVAKIYIADPFFLPLILKQRENYKKVGINEINRHVPLKLRTSREIMISLRFFPFSFPQLVDKTFSTA